MKEQISTTSAIALSIMTFFHYVPEGSIADKFFRWIPLFEGVYEWIIANYNWLGMILVVGVLARWTLNWKILGGAALAFILFTTFAV